MVARVGPTNAHDIFLRCIERARNLVRLHEAAHGKATKPEKYLSDAHRAAIVLAISALDAYVRTYVLEQIRRLLNNRTATLPGKLADQIKRFLDPDQLLDAARKDDLLDRVEKAFKRDFEKRSFQGVRAIAEGLEFVGVSDVFKEVASLSGENEDNLRKELERFTQRRHAIAHRGDYDFSQNPTQEQPATKKEANDCIRLVVLIVDGMKGLKGL